MNPNPHTIVPVESLIHSPVSSTGSASVLEWNSNSDSELFHLSSPPSAPALTAQPTSPTLSLFSSPPLTSPSRAPSSSPEAPLAESTVTMHWPELHQDAQQVEATPILNTNVVTVAVVDDDPALNEHPEGLKSLMERSYMTDLRSIVNKWQFETSNADSADRAPDAPSVITESEEGSTVAPEDTSMTSTVLGYVHYSSEEAELAQNPVESAPATPVSISPPAAAVANGDQADGNKQDMIPPFDSSSPYSAAVSLISIAEYFRRKAETVEVPTVDDVLGTTTTATTTTATPAQRAVSPRSALSYFSPPASTSGEGQNTAFDRVFGCRPERLRSMPTDASQVETAPVHRTAVSEDGYQSPQPPKLNKMAGASVSELVANGVYSPYSSSTERESKVHSPIFATAFDILRNGGNVQAPLVGPSVSSNSLQGVANATEPQAKSQGTTLGPQMYIARPIWSPRPCELEFREALHGASLETPKLPAAHATASTVIHPISRPSYRWDDQPISVVAPSGPVAKGAAPRKARPPLPTPPSVRRQMAATTPQFTLRGELAKPHEYIPASFAQAVPSCWTGRLSARSPMSSPSLRSSSPALTAHPSDTSVPRSFGPRQSRSPSLVDSPPPPRRRRSPPPQEARNLPEYPLSLPSPQPTHRRASRSRSRSDRVPSPDEWLPLVYPSDDDASDAACPIPPAPALAPAPARTGSPSWPAYVPSPVPSSRASVRTCPIECASWGQPSFSWCGTAAPPVATSAWGNSFTPRRLRFATPDTPSPGRTPPPVPPPMMGGPIGLGPQSFHSPPGWGGLDGFSHSSTPPTPVVPPAVAPNISVNAAWFTPEWKYSFGDATLVIRVETHLYRIHRHFFERHSEYFRKMLANYYLSENSHVFLPEVKRVDFEHLLSIFYPDDLTKQSITTLAGWSSVLSLAQKWEMPQVRALATKHIGEHPQASPMDKVILAHKHGLRNPAPAWLLPALKSVCARPTPVALADAEQLDMATVVKIWEVQCETRVLPVGYGGNWRDDAQIERLVKAKFGPFAGLGAQGVAAPIPGPPPSVGRTNGPGTWGSFAHPVSLPPPPMPMPTMGPYAYTPPGPYIDTWSGHRRS